VGLYDTHILPRLIRTGMQQEVLTPIRRRLTQEASGRVLEIGVGSGINLPLYSDRVTQVIGIEPSAPLLAMARESAARSTVPIDLRDASVEAIPLDAASVDTVVSTFTLCSVPDVTQALGEIRRVLRPGGRLLFAEHGSASDARVRRWQNLLTPMWKRCCGGCHLNRDMARLIESAGFVFERLETGYLEGPKVMTFVYEGSARLADRQA
jgi:ubiquinone/menaquinone biosynthesis C-methylase UbiE